MTSPRNRDALAGYEKSAQAYADVLSPLPPEPVADSLHRLAAQAGKGASVLEVASGPGRDADFIETLGLNVRRTDAAQSFLDMQTARGKRVEKLDIITDEFDGPYDAIMALRVLLHIDPELTDGVLAKVTAALAPGGAFLVSVRENEDAPETVAWARDAFAARLEGAGLRIIRDEAHFYPGEDWRTFLAVRA